MSEEIETTVMDIAPRQPVPIRAAYSKKLKLIAAAQHRSMTAQVEFWIDQNFTPEMVISSPAPETAAAVNS